MTSVELTVGDTSSNSGMCTYVRGTPMNTSRQLCILATTVVVGGALTGCSGSSPAPTAASPTPSAPTGYVVASQSEVRGLAPDACGGVDLPQMLFGRVNSQMRAQQVDKVTICRNPSKATAETYMTPQSPHWATIDGLVATTEQVQVLLDVLGTPDEPTPIPNSCTAVGVIPADAMYLTLTDGTNLQPVIPVDHCDRQIDAARGTIEAFP